MTHYFFFVRPKVLLEAFDGFSMHVFLNKKG